MEGEEINSAAINPSLINLNALKQNAAAADSYHLSVSTTPNYTHTNNNNKKIYIGTHVCVWLQNT